MVRNCYEVVKEGAIDMMRSDTTKSFPETDVNEWHLDMM